MMAVIFFDKKSSNTQLLFKDARGLLDKCLSAHDQMLGC